MTIQTFATARKALLIIAAIVCSLMKLNAQNSKTEILWDNYGIPHIYARNIAEMYYAFGWAQMNNHADLILKLYGQARGRAAEYWGNQFINSDKKILLFKLPERAKKIYVLQAKEFKEYYDAFINGMNAYAQAHPQAIGKEYQQVLPLTATDVIAHLIRISCIETLGGADIAGTYKLIYGSDTTQAREGGSNAIAIGPSRSASKNTLLLTNPHTPWSDFSTWIEGDLNAPALHAYGATFAGLPFLGTAFNENLGWAHTNNYIDGSDVYELSLKDDGYLLDNTVVSFQKESVFLKERQKDGTMKEETIQFKYSKHGPIIGEKNGKAYAIRIAGLDSPFMFVQYHKMMKATNFSEFEVALKMMQIPIFNITYADKQGNIMYLFDGYLPVRPEGNRAFWRRMINGTTSELIWNRIHPYEDLPKLFNPSTGFVQNANDPPWTCTFPFILNPDKYPAYLSYRDMGLRPQRAINMIKNDSSIAFDELVNYKMNTGVEAAYRFLDDLLQAVTEHPDSIAERAAIVLKNWDRTTNQDSRGALLFFEWYYRTNSKMYAKPWSSSEPLTTPRGLNDHGKAVELLISAAKEVQKVYGAIDIPWGEVNRFRIGTIDLPGNGGEEGIGIYRAMRFALDKDGKYRAIHGDSYVSIVEFGKRIKAQGLLSYGNASQPGNKNIGDQLFLLSQKKLRPILFYREEVLKKVEKRETLRMANKQ